jgi:Fe-S-cluster-containing dehydrogenase component
MTGSDQHPVAASDLRQPRPRTSKPQQASTTDSDHLVITMGLSYNIYLNSSRIYGCKNCKTHLSNHDDILSRNFRGQHGKAYLFDSVVNVTESDPNERNMTTGRHIVRDIHCRQCKETVGWKYDKAYEASEKYKEGKFILEAELLCTVT